MKGNDKERCLEKILRNILGAKPYKIVSAVLIVLFFIKLPVNALTFHLIHVNIFHLISNLIALVVIGKSWWRIILGYAITSVLFLFTSKDVVGFSAVIYFVWATYMWNIFKAPFDAKIKTIAVVLFVMITSYFTPQISFYMHFAPFILGFLVSALIATYRRVNNDINAALND